MRVRLKADTTILITVRLKPDTTILFTVRLKPDTTVVGPYDTACRSSNNATATAGAQRAPASPNASDSGTTSRFDARAAATPRNAPRPVTTAVRIEGRVSSTR